MSEKENPENSEEQTLEVEESQEGQEAQELSPEEGTREQEAVEDTPEHTEVVETEEAEIETAAEVPAPKKGLMQRRESFDQSSVPNAHKGYSGTPPIIMLLIVSVFIVLSLIFATAAING